MDHETDILIMQADTCNYFSDLKNSFRVDSSNLILSSHIEAVLNLSI